MDALGIYVQVPFCASKCSFCNFGSRVSPAVLFDGYTRALAQEIERLPTLFETARVGHHLLTYPVDTVYVGGGTPSLLGAERLGTVCEALRRRFQLAASVESTLEVTPGSVDERFLQLVRAFGFNRLSIGAQTFEDRELRSVGRLHSAAETSEMVRRAQRAGFSNINLDLIAGLPYQTAASWKRSLRRAVALGPQHVSVYLFEIDEKSRLGREVLEQGDRYHAEAVPDEGFMADAYETAREFLASGGYAQYEISNFALPGFESRHNRKYWRLEPYVGMGAGAHSFDGDYRWENESAVEIYQDKLARGQSPLQEVRRLTADEQIEEFFFLGLRERHGIDLALARQRWGNDRLAPWEARVAALVADQWLERAAGRVRMAERALLVSNEIFQEFLA